MAKWSDGHARADTRRTLHAHRRKAEHNRDLAMMIVALVVIAVVAALILAPDVPWLDVARGMAARVAEQWR